MKMNDFMNLNKPRRRQILEVLLQFIIVTFSLLIPICIPNHYYYHYCQAFEGLSRLSCWLSLPPLILLTPIDQVPKQIYNQTFEDYLHGLSGEPGLPANLYCCLNALSAHSDPTNIGAASDQRSSSSSAATAGARRSFRFDYLSEQSEIGVTSGLVQKWCIRPTWHTTEIRHPQPFGRPSFILTSLYTSGSGAPEGPRHLASIRPRP